MAVKFITVKGSGTLAETPFYVGIPQHERIINKSNAYRRVANSRGYKVAEIRSVFEALTRVIKSYQEKGMACALDEIATLRNSVRGSFATATGPWVKGVNFLQTNAVEADAYKGIFAGIVPVNMTGGANPHINSVFDQGESAYDIVKGTNTFSIAGVDLAPDTEAADEGVWFDSAAGVATKAVITLSELGDVEAHFETALTPGVYTCRVMTRSGLGDRFGVKSATRANITVVA